MIEDDVKLEEERREELQAELPTDADESIETEEDDDDDDDLDLDREFAEIDPNSCCSEEGIREGILYDAAVTASREAELIADLGARCRVELFELLLKADLDKEKIKEKVKSLQEFLVASEHRTDELIARVERLLKNN